MNCITRHSISESFVLADNNFRGSTIPTSYAGLTSLQLLNLAKCSLTGSLDASIANLDKLVKLYLDQNMLSGVLPTNLFASNSLGKLCSVIKNVWGYRD